MARRPTSIVSYSHDSPEHEARVLSLAERLRRDGVDCELDAYQVSPPEGWPGWMRRQLQERDFSIVVCTETYARRFAGDEADGKGKGVTWEGQQLRQILYESGKNDRVIPVIFDRKDLPHIPLELKGATYYDVSTDEGYDRLHRALTAQPLVERGMLGEVRRHLPLLTPEERETTALLVVCDDPVPLEVIAPVMRGSVAEVGAKLARLVAGGFIQIENGSVLLLDRSVGGIPSLPTVMAGVALDAILDFISEHQRGAVGRAQLMNAVILVRAAEVHSASPAISRAFRILHLLLKTRGDKRLVLDMARRSIEGAKAPGRGPEQTKDEAVAAVCGVSWVYQRIGRLDQARVEAERSRDLGLAVQWDRNTAFCEKCLARLARMEAETKTDSGQRSGLLVDSVRLLREAVTRFAALGMEAEIGDCYSLLARTHLVSGDLASAREAISEAEQRLVEPATKDYLDLQIVKGDLIAHSNRRAAEALYSEVLANVTEDDAQRSEIFARAYLQRGRMRTALRDSAGALNDFKRAVEIWEALEDPSADLAHWEIERSADWLDRDARHVLDAEPAAIRVRVARAVREGAAGRPVAKAKRAKLPEKYLRDLIREAREQLAIERPEW